MYTEYMYKDSLAHFGILGMKWGRRRYQNSDGSLTPEGRVRYGVKGSGKDKGKKHLTEKQKKTLKKVAVGVGAAALTGAAVYAGTKYVKNKKLSEKLIKDALASNSLVKDKEAADILEMQRLHPISFDKKYEGRQLQKRIRGKLESGYLHAKSAYESDPSEANKAKLREAASRYVNTKDYVQGNNRALKKNLREAENYLGEMTGKSGIYRVSKNDLKFNGSDIVSKTTGKTYKNADIADVILKEKDTISKQKQAKNIHNLWGQYTDKNGDINMGQLMYGTVDEWHTGKVPKSQKDLLRKMARKYVTSDMKPVSKSKIDGLAKLVKVTDLNPQELEARGLIDLNAQEMSMFKKQYPDLWNWVRKAGSSN